MEAYAIAKNVKGSAQKSKLVIDLIRGLKVNEALAILRFTQKRSAHPIERLLRSAINNAEQRAQAGNIAVDVDELWVKECFVGKGVTKNRRRVRPAPMGRAYRERRHYSHITITVSSERARSVREDTGRQAGAKTAAAAKTETVREGREERTASGLRSGELWVRKYILTDSGLDITGRGIRAGSRSGTSASCCFEDLKLKRELKRRFASAGVSQIEIERAANRVKIIIFTSRPGIIIGRKGAEIEALKKEISRRTGREVFINIQEIHKPELNAQLQAEKIAQQLEKRIAFRRAMRKAVDEAQRFGAQGIKVRVSGRLNGAEIARSEWTLQGRLPLHTLRADIDYGFAEANTTFGVIGVKVWIYRGDIMNPREAMMKERS